jgi:CRP/FNR family cyclic AMP-dependent transcriptional regulator
VQLFSHDSKADALGRTPLFGTLSRGDLVALAKLTEDLEVEEGKVLAREGEIGQEFFVIVDGEVSVSRDGREVRTLGPGDFFGEIGVLEKTLRTASVVAKTPVRLVTLSHWDLKRVGGAMEEIRATLEE